MRLLLCTLLLVFLPATAFAYIDPGSGSMALQALLAALAAGLVAIKLYFRRIVAFFSRATRAPEKSAETPSADVSPGDHPQS